MYNKLINVLKILIISLHFKGRFEHRINDESDSGGELDDKFMFDSVSK